ncbi:MAG: hypothetical protein B6I24_08760 [Bacteroidetes bacterium 4572_128]|nr:MAG: hypothetical protein B6I24_08760 [Bacteroidetes bacterium 4572_128]
MKKNFFNKIRKISSFFGKNFFLIKFVKFYHFLKKFFFNKIRKILLDKNIKFLVVFFFFYLLIISNWFSK